MGNSLIFIAAFYFLYLITEGGAQICDSKYGPAGNISISGYVYEGCWSIYVPVGSFIRLNLTTLKLSQKACGYNSLKITVIGTGEEYKYCESTTFTNPATALNNVTVSLFSHRSYRLHSSFEIQYEIQDIECSHKDSFRCTRYTCIPRSQVCDGIKHCKNGEDEVGCETGVLAIGGVAESRESGVTWMKEQSTTAWGWKENTPRAVVALFLASAANFNGTVLEEELLVKQAEIRVAVALFRSILTNSDLSMLVNVLLVTCHNPRNFFGKNLVKRLKTQVEDTENFIHPTAYLALCNANENWPEKSMDNLNGVLSSDSDYPFVRDIQAMAVMALSCVFKRDLSNGSQAPILYRDTIRRFKTLQQKDGSFGNAHTTSLITQALIASGHENSKDWNLRATIEYLMRELNSSSVDFLSMYLSLPILNGKTLVDISKTNCSSNPRKYQDITSELNDYLGSKIRIKYFLYVGDDKNVIYSISLKVPENFTAYEIMQWAAAEDLKYKFEEKSVSGNIYVYKIANVTNDPEAGKFWLLYISSSNNDTSELIHSSKSPDELIMKEDQHLVMWYKTAFSNE